MDFVTSLPILTDWKEDSYNSIFVMVNWLTKIVNYKLVQVTINVSSLIKIIINMVIRYHGLLGLIIINQELLFTPKF